MTGYGASADGGMYAGCAAHRRRKPLQVNVCSGACGEHRVSGRWMSASDQKAAKTLPRVRPEPKRLGKGYEVNGHLPGLNSASRGRNILLLVMHIMLN